MESWSHIDYDLKVQLMISSDCEAEILCCCHLLKLLHRLELSAAALGHTVPPRAWLPVGCLSNSSSSRLAWTRWGSTRDACLWACSPGQGFKCLMDWTGWRGNWTSESLRISRSSDPNHCQRKGHLHEQPVKLAGGCKGLHFALHVSYPALVEDKFEAVCFAEIPGWFCSSLFTRIKWSRCHLAIIFFWTITCFEQTHLTCVVFQQGS